MYRRSARLASKTVESDFVNQKIKSESRDDVVSAKKRRSSQREADVLASKKLSKSKKHDSENAVQVKAEDNRLSVSNDLPKNMFSVVKTEGQTSAQKITKDGKYIGAHVSISGGLNLAVERALEIGAKSFAMFLRSQRQWTSKPLEQKTADIFQSACEKHGFIPDVILPHGIYLMNCGSPDHETLTKSRQVLVDELMRCEMLGLTLYNFHPGSTCGNISVDECLNRIAESINLAHQQTKYVVTVLENMSCQGNTVGGKFEELRGIIDGVHDKSRIGVCLDTCHAFAAGFDLRSKDGFEDMMSDFERIIGIEYLKGVHLNDSKGELGCHLDRHENIGRGKIGKKAFQFLMNDKRFNGIPMVLETPCRSDDTYSKEISLLYSMQEQ